MLQERKQLRLNHACYNYPSFPCSITIAVKNREEIFGSRNDAFTREAVMILRDLAAQYNVPVHVALFMPDHVHLCIEASPNCTIIDFVKALKSKIATVGFRYGCSSFWQRSFFDHFLRKEENLGKVIRYILDNPRRKGLIDYWWNYSYRYSNRYTDEQLKTIE